MFIHAVVGKIQVGDQVILEDMIHYTANADLGISLDKPNNLNYLYSLPNKIFDYIAVGIPVMASDLPEVSAIINNYKVGISINEIQADNIASNIKDMMQIRNTYWDENLLKAKEALSWENEAKALDDLY